MNLKELARTRGTSIAKLARMCNVPASTIYAISSGDTKLDNVGIGLFIKLAEALDTDAETLYNMVTETNDYVYHSITLDDLPDEERKLLDIFHSMDKRARADLLKIARSLSASESAADERMVS